MAKLRTVFKCQQCGAEHHKWSGQCNKCKEWNSLVEEVVEKSSKAIKGSINIRGSGKVVRLSELEGKRVSVDRLKTGSGEFDRVLGGGIVPGSVVLVAGEPGIGKSTLLTQLAMGVGDPSVKPQDDMKGVLYVCGEESVGQVGMRVKRLNRAVLDSSGKPQNDPSAGSGQASGLSSIPVLSTEMLLLAETDVDVIVQTMEQEKPGLVVVDSIQTLQTQDLSGMAGSVGQIRESTNRLIAQAKRQGVAVFVVGHVTKEGSIAGPKVLEHMVDTVLTIEGEKTGLWRILRAYKNRFGPTDEVGVFEMNETGMKDVTNPSGAFLEESQGGKPGSVVIALLEGTRPVLVEVQALAVKSQLAIPRRVAQGVGVNKLQLMCAVLTKHCRLAMGSYDVFVNVAGGLRITEPAADLGIALAIASSVKTKAVPDKSVVIGEVGLLGEVRKVAMQKKRIQEAKRMGYKKVISSDKHRDLKGVVGRLIAK